MFASINTIILEYLPYYDVAAMFILLLLIISIFLRRLNRAKSSKIFLILLLVTALTDFFDIGSMIIIKHYIKREFMLIDDNFYFSNTWITLFFMFRYSIVYVYTIYILSLTNSLQRIKKSKLFLSLLIVPFLLMQIVILTNSFTGIFYNLSWDANGQLLFGSGKLFLILPAFECYYLIFLIAHLIKNKRLFSNIKFYTLFLMIPVTIISFIVRLIDNETIIEVLLFSLAFLIIVQNVESPELLVDSKTGLSSSKQFNFIIERDYLYKTYGYIVFVNFINYSDIYRKFNYDSSNRYIKLISRQLELIVNGNIIYALDEGLFAIKYDDREKALEYSDKIFKELTNVRFIDLNFVPELSISIVNIKDDFESVEKLIQYVDNFHDDNRIGIYEFGEFKNDINEIIKILIDSILENAFKYNNFRVYYQPIYDLSLNKFTTAEALCRIEDNKYGLIIPDQFIPYAETKGIISQIDLFVIEKVMILLNKIDITKYDTFNIYFNI